MSGRRTPVRPQARRAAILDMVERSGNVSVLGLVEELDASPETIRRDLSTLADMGKIRKIHGGAAKLPLTQESIFSERAKQNALAKLLVGEKLAKTIAPGQTLFIDTGTTTLACANVISKIPNLTIITNSTHIADVFAQKSNNANVILLGGTYRHDNAQTVGANTVMEIGKYRADQAILTIGTVDKMGAADFSQEEAQVARAMIENSASITIVADVSKLNQRSTYNVCDLPTLDKLILDKAPDSEMCKYLHLANVELL